VAAGGGLLGALGWFRKAREEGWGWEGKKVTRLWGVKQSFQGREWHCLMLSSIRRFVSHRA